MTVSNVTLADAMPRVASGGSNARASTRTRARIPTTLRDDKTVAGAARLGRLALSDLRGWWLLVDQPGSLTDWRATPQPLKVPADSGRLRIAAAIDKWFLGALCAGLSVLFFLAGGLFRWLAGHPVRRWAAVAILAASTVAGVVSTHIHAH